MISLFQNVLLSMLVLTAPAFAGGKPLTASEIVRVKAMKALIHEVDKKTLEQTVRELESTDYPSLNLQIKEAMAKVYVEMAEEYKIERARKAWLYSMVSLNMAYLQFEGGSGGGTSSLNKLILRKLKATLPNDVIEHRGFRFGLG